MTEGIFNIVFIIIFVVAICIFIISFSIFISPKFRAKIMKKQIESTKYMLEESKDSIKDVANLGINIKENILNENEDSLKNMSKKEAEIAGEKIKIYASSIKEGLSQNKVYCKHCGSLIDSDSKFCKNCGKEL